MNTWLRAARGVTIGSRPGPPAYHGPEKLNATESKRVYLLSTGQARDPQGRFLPKLKVMGAIDVVRSERKPPMPPGNAGEGGGQTGPKQRMDMNSWIRLSAELGRMSSAEINVLKLQGKLR